MGIVEQKLKDKAKISLIKGGYVAYATTKDCTQPNDNSDGHELQVLIKSMSIRKERLLAIPE